MQYFMNVTRWSGTLQSQFDIMSHHSNTLQREHTPDGFWSTVEEVNELKGKNLVWVTDAGRNWTLIANNELSVKV